MSDSVERAGKWLSEGWPEVCNGCYGASNIIRDLLAEVERLEKVEKSTCKAYFMGFNTGLAAGRKQAAREEG